MTLTTNRRIPQQKSFLRRSFASIKGRGFTSNVADVVALIIGFGSAATVHFVGDLPISEVILVALLPFLLAARGRRVLEPEFKTLFILLALWLGGQMVSDMYRHTETINWIRGDAAIIFFGLDILGLLILLRKNDRRRIIFLAASAIGSVLLTLIHPSDFALDQPWKFGYASGVTSLVLLISCFFYARRRYAIAGLLILGVVAVNLLENYRSPIGQLLLVVALVFPVIPEQVGRLRILPRSRGVVRVAILFGLSIGTAWLAGRLVDYVTSAGLISEQAREKNEAEKKGGSLLGGRPEFQVSLQAVKDSPIIGFGSWPQDPRYIEMLLDIQLEQGVIDRDDFGDYADFIPTHSHLMGAWVWAGILGAVFWFYVLWLVIRTIISLAISRPALAPFYMYLIIGLLWGVLFSPFGLSVRVGDAVILVIAFDLLGSKDVTIKVANWSRRSSWVRLGLRGQRTIKWGARRRFPRRSFPVGRRT